jgi:hypothetical protein
MYSWCDKALTELVEAQDAPTLSFKGTGPYIVVGLDLDAPFQSVTVLGPILHWIQSGLKPDSADSVLSSAGTPFIAKYVLNLYFSSQASLTRQIRSKLLQISLDFSQEI